MASGERRALEAAWRREKRGEDGYQKRAASTGNPAASIAFQTLALRQRKYLAVIQRVRTALHTRESSPARKIRFPVLPPVSRVVESIMRKVAHSKHTEIHSYDRIDFHAFLWALGFEEKSWMTYTRQISHFEGRLTGRLFEFLQRQKGEHCRILDDVLAYSCVPGKSSMPPANLRLTKKEKNS